MGAAWRAVCGGPAGCPPRPRPCASATVGATSARASATASFFMFFSAGYGRLLLGILQTLVNGLDEHVRCPRLVLAEAAVPVFGRTGRFDLVEGSALLDQI